MAMFARMPFLRADLWVMFDCIASDYKDILPLPSEDKTQSRGSQSEVRGGLNLLLHLSFSAFF